MGVEVHFAIHFEIDDVHYYRSACYIPDVTIYEWTINRDLVTCPKCKACLK